MSRWVHMVSHHVRERGYLHAQPGVNLAGQAAKLIEEASEMALTLDGLPSGLRRWFEMVALEAKKRFEEMPNAAPQAAITDETLEEEADVLVVMACVMDVLWEWRPVQEQALAALRKSAADVDRGAPGWEG